MKVYPGSNEFDEGCVMMGMGCMYYNSVNKNWCCFVKLQYGKTVNQDDVFANSRLFYSAAYIWLLPSNYVCYCYKCHDVHPSRNTFSTQMMSPALRSTYTYVRKPGRFTRRLRLLLKPFCVTGCSLLHALLNLQ